MEPPNQDESILELQLFGNRFELENIWQTPFHLS